MDPIVLTALQRAVGAAEAYLTSATEARKENAVALLDYLEAARSVITGLEEEVDEILSEAKSVALFEWDRRARLYERIDLFLHRHRLRPLLDQAIRGMRSCLKPAGQDALGAARGEHAERTLEHANALRVELSKYLDALSGDAPPGRVHYAGPSGIRVVELARIQELIADGEQDDEGRRRAIRSLVEDVQKTRVRHGFVIAADVQALIQDVAATFRVPRPE